jgi:lysocardiolipin and lysophospholipid acyltransferase
MGGLLAPLKGVAYILLLGVSAFLYCVFLLAPSLPLLLSLPPARGRGLRLYRQWVSMVLEAWFTLAVAWYEIVGGVKVRITGDALPRGERALLVSNHYCRTDWMFLWSLALRTGQLSQLRIVLKDSLKSLVGFGWAMQMSLFVFVRRNKQQDLASMDSLLSYLVRNQFPSSFIFFPEGTDLHEIGLSKSRQYAELRGLPLYERVLHPKTAGFLKIVDRMAPSLDAVYDVTVAYETAQEGERPNEKSLMQGRFPQVVHMHVKRIPVGSMPQGEDARKEWLSASFARKEVILGDFYGKKTRFEGEDRTSELEDGVRDRCWSALALFCGLAAIAR